MASGELSKLLAGYQDLSVVETGPLDPILQLVTVAAESRISSTSHS